MNISKDDEEERRRELEVDKICNKVIKGLDGNQTNKILTEEWILQKPDKTEETLIIDYIISE